jgi:hypothetical protein
MDDPVAIAPLHGEKPEARRVKKLLPGMWADTVTKIVRFPGLLQMVAAGLLLVHPANRQVIQAGDLIQNNSALPDSGANQGEPSRAQVIENLLERRLGYRHAG